jgi:hypothetical protein
MQSSLYRGVLYTSLIRVFCNTLLLPFLLVFSSYVLAYLQPGGHSHTFVPAVREAVCM